MSIESEACHREISGLWSKYGIYHLLNALAQCINNNARIIAETGLHPVEVEVKDRLVKELREAAIYFDKK